MSVYIAPTAMAAVRAGSAVRAAQGRCGAWADQADETCPDCGQDVFGCTCPPAGDPRVADEVRAAIAEAERKRAKAVAELRVYQGLAKDLRAQVVALTAQPATPAVTVDGLRRQLLEDYVARLVHGPKRTYAAALVASVLDGTPAPVAPDAGWVEDVQRKVRRWTRRAEQTARIAS